jgi:hypothetical protein
MSADERDVMMRRMIDSLEEAMAAAQREFETDEALDILDLAELALLGIQVVHWRPPGHSRPVCPTCGRVDRMYQQVDSGSVECLCQLAA